MDEKFLTKSLLKHYLSSVFIYGILFIVIANCPIFYEVIENETFNYIYFFLFYFIGYVLIAPIILFTFRPKSVLDSGNLKILSYIKRQFSKTKSTKEFLENIEPKEDEKQAMMSLFVKAFFGVTCVNMLCNTYLPSLGYNFDFLRVMWTTAIQYIHDGSDILGSFIQYVADTGDMWLKLILTISTSVLTFSYLTDSDVFKNKIKSVDTTPLGVLSCLVCYYPLTILTTKVIAQPLNSQIPVNNTLFFAVLNVLIILANFIAMISVVRLFGKSGNLTNRGIVTGFPYNVIRHPAYTMQVIYIILCSIPLYFLPELTFGDKISLFIGVLVWMYIYYLRAITEERHLMKDEKYQQYVEKVKYRFIPWVF
jgi:protein-S-isoprenylcysteine O-methyltransferase Ste14